MQRQPTSTNASLVVCKPFLVDVRHRAPRFGSYLSGMTIDGFHSHDAAAFAGYSPRVATRFFDLVRKTGKRFDVRVTGLEHIPAGRALLVGNHAFGWYSMFPMAEALTQLGRPVWVLGDHLWWRLPFLRRLASSVGVVDGTPENVSKLLEGDELVMVLPGGLREAIKQRELRYQLLWGHRYGFVRAALRHHAPMVPVAAVGTDEMFDFVGNPYSRGRKLHLGRFPLPLPTRLWPRRVEIRFRIGEPVTIPDGADAEDFGMVRRLRREIEGALHEEIETELAARCGIDLD
jgi:1-acyl-sn-glycerol-3-phosphate acyltransferase